MMLLEDQGKRLFREFSIPVPKGMTVKSRDQITTQELPAVVKALVPTGGRGKAGGVAIAASADELVSEVDRILSLSIAGHPVRSVLIENALDISREMYLSILIDRSLGIPVLLASAEGGMEVESLPEGSVQRRPIHPFLGTGPRLARELATALDLKGREGELEGMLGRLWELFVSMDCELIEINPLVLTKGGKLVAAD
jgi:succinyl-CoA synthetase beta subunit